jgi:predicted  nucleic acid-binding Zn-ribbon protein
MNEQLRLLIELQTLDSLILETRLKIDAAPSTILSHEKPLKKAQEVYENAKKELENLEKKKRDKELEIAELKEKINKLRQRSSEIKDNKAYQAHLKEIEKAEKDFGAKEDEILIIMESIEATATLLKSQNALVEKERTNFEAVKDELQKKIVRIENELKNLKEDRKKITNKIEGDIYNQYMTLMKTARGIAVVEAKNEVCRGCNIHIPPQLFVEIKSNQEIINCLQCKRILYYIKKDEPENKAQ